MGEAKRKFCNFKIQKATSNLSLHSRLYCHTEKLIIEIDGSIHQLPEVKAIDDIRQKP